MSKSYHNTIEIFGTEKETRARIMRVVTDSKQLQDVKDPETCNVFALYRLFASDAERQEMEARYRAGGMGYGDAKKKLFEGVWTYFAPYRQKRAELEKDAGYVDAVLREGAERARAEARKTLNAARKAVGLD
jgi:tryptophanyl-tRNA synthetase